MLVMTRFSMRSRTATHSLATLSIIACMCSVPTSCLLTYLYMQLYGLSIGSRYLSRVSPNPGEASSEAVTDSYREPAVQWLSDLPLKLAIGVEPPIVQRRKRLRQLIWNIGP